MVNNLRLIAILEFGNKIKTYYVIPAKELKEGDSKVLDGGFGEVGHQCLLSNS